MTIFGWDLSHYDAPDARAAIGEGIAFMVHKAGGDRDDPEIGQWWQLIQPYRDRLLLGAYWVLYPGTPSIRADLFLARLDATCPGWRDGPFILQADCERWNGDPSTQPGLADITMFCDRLAFKAPQLRPVVYAPKWAYGGALAGLRYPLWASSYVTGTGAYRQLYPGDDSARWASYSGQTPAILQYSSKATIGGQTTCDANAFRGDLAALTALTAPGWGTDMNELTKSIQTALKAAGYDPGAIDGVWGAKTQAAFTAALKATGPRGPAGPAGPQGPAGPAGALPPRVTLTGDIRAA